MRKTLLNLAYKLEYRFGGNRVGAYVSHHLIVSLGG